MKITKEMLQAMRQDLQDAVKAVEEKYGVTVKFGRATYDPASADFKVSVIANSEDGEAREKHEVDFGRYHLVPSDLGMSFNLMGETLTIKGLQPRRRSYPLVVMTSSGMKCMRMDDVVIRAIQKARQS